MLYNTKIFRDGTRWDNSFHECVTWSAAEQLEDFLRAFPVEIVSINYSVTHKGYNGAGIAQYCNHILLTYRQ